MSNYFLPTTGKENLTEPKLPKARLENIVTQDLDSEILIYDLGINKALCLNETSKVVWQACDGKTTFDEFRRKTGPDFSDDLIWLTLEKLKQDNLFDKDEEIAPNFNGLSRREVVKKIGFASMIALPIIASIVAPSAIHAQSSGNCAGACIADGSEVGCRFSNSNQSTCLTTLINRCCSMRVSQSGCVCVGSNCVGTVECTGCIATGQESSNNLGATNHGECLINLASACCSGALLNGGTCVCNLNTNTCSGASICL